MEFSQKSGVSSPTDLIPNGFLCWAMLTHRGMKDSQSGGRYADLEFVVADNQPHARRKFWAMVGDPDYDGNSEGYRNMGMVSLTRMVEAAGIVDHKNPASYEQLNGATCDQVMNMLDGKYVAVRIKVEKGQEGYSDKNTVGDFLTPNEQSSGHKNFVKLSNGDHGISSNPAARGGAGAGGFGGNARPAPSHQQAGGGFGRQTQPAVQQGGQGGAKAPLAGSTQTMSPSNPGGTGGSSFNPNKAPAFLANHQR